MNAIQILSSQPWVAPLGWALVHFLWQGLVIAALYAAGRKVMARASSPNTRYLLACATLAVMMAAPLVTWGLMRPSHASPEDAYRIHATPPAASTSDFVTPTTTTLPASVRAVLSGPQPAQFLLWVVMAWLAGALAFWVRLAGGWVVATRMRSMLVRRAPPEWQEVLRTLGARIGLTRPVRLLVSSLVQVPTVVGWLRPLVLVPVGAFGGLPPEYLEAVLVHELAHIRRHDYLVNILQSIAEALLFYHPAVWWVSGVIRAERELCCDDVAVSVAGDALTYVRALAQLESHRPAHLCPAVAADGGSLPDRIARLLGQSRPNVRSGVGPGVVTVALLLLAAAYGLFGQSSAHPEFAVASIKRNPTHGGPDGPMGVSYKPGGRMTAVNAPLKLLIQFAYAAHDSAGPGHSLPLPAFQVAGGPSWVNSEGYDIEAKPEDNTDPKQAWLMLQTLLADRFKLTVHRETRELPVYDLTAAKSGLKLPPPKEVTCVSFPPGTMPHFTPGKVDCGYVAGPFGTPFQGQRMDGSKIHMADLASRLAFFVMGRPVLDKTGFTGEFDLNLRFTADETTLALLSPGGPGNPDGARPAADPNIPNIFAALEEQLGLKLVPAKGPVEVLVIDQAERPEAN